MRQSNAAILESEKDFLDKVSATFRLADFKWKHTKELENAVDVMVDGRVIHLDVNDKAKIVKFNMNQGPTDGETADGNKKTKEKKGKLDAQICER